MQLKYNKKWKLKTDDVSNILGEYILKTKQSIETRLNTQRWERLFGFD